MGAVDADVPGHILPGRRVSGQGTMVSTDRLSVALMPSSTVSRHLLYSDITSSEEVGGVYTTKLRKVGGSIMLAIPPTVLEMLHLHPGAEVGLTIDAGHLVVDPHTRPNYTLDELLAQCDSQADITAEDRAWLDDEPTGRELI